MFMNYSANAKRHIYYILSYKNSRTYLPYYQTLLTLSKYILSKYPKLLKNKREKP